MHPEPHNHPSNALAVTGVGMVTSIGHDFAMTTTGLSADITRMQEGPWRTRQGKALVGAPIKGCAESWPRNRRLWKLAALAASEALARAGFDGVAFPRPGCAVLWVLPQADRPGYAARPEPRFTKQFLERSGINGQVSVWQDFPCGHAGALMALKRAREILAAEKASGCLIGGADSLLQFWVLRWLQQSDRLKTPSYVDGVIPGEAAAFVLVETAAGARRHHAHVHAWVNGVGSAMEEATVVSDQPCRGQGLVAAVRAALEQARVSPKEIGAIFCDLNGESYRAREWGLATVRIDFPDSVNLFHPADCLGDVGAASGALLLGYAAASLASSKVLNDMALVFAGSETGDRAAVVLTSPEPRHRPPRYLVRVGDKEEPPGSNDADTDFLKSVSEDFFDETLFLWHQRELAFDSPKYTLRDVASLERRLDASLEGLRIMRTAGLEIWKQFLAWKEPGEVFALTVTAFEGSGEVHLEQVLQACVESDALCRGLETALAWLPYEQVERYIQHLLGSPAASLRRAALAACAIHRRDPGPPLRDAITSDVPSLRARAFRAIGELGRTDLLSWLRSGFADADKSVRFNAAWSATLLSLNVDSLAVLRASAESGDRHREQALQTAIRRMDFATAKAWEASFARSREGLRMAIVAAGAIGDPERIPWLTQLMKTSALARVAGEAFTMITGIELAHEGLEKRAPVDFESGLTESPSEESGQMDPDEYLPWPDPALIQKWWTDNQGRFQKGTRYLLGKPMTVEWLWQVLAIARQRQRAAAALELAIRQPGQPLFEVRAPAFRQQATLK